MRIISLLPGATEMLFALGLGDWVVGVSHECDFPPEARSKPQVTRSNIDSTAPGGDIDNAVRAALQEGSALYSIDGAAVAGLAPDLIVTQAQCDVCAIRYQDVLDLVAAEPALRQTKVLSLAPASVDEVLEDILRVAAAAGVPERGAPVVAALRARIDIARKRALSSYEKPRVACVEWLEPPMIAGNWIPDLVRWAGGIPFELDHAKSEYISWADIEAFQPEIVVLLPCGFDLPRTILEAARLASVPAWRRIAGSARVFAVDGSAYFNRPGPRLIDSLEILSAIFHPEVSEAFAPRRDRPWEILSLQPS